MEPLDTWRAEITAELTAAQTALDAALAERTEAKKALEEARAVRAPISEALGRLNPKPVANALARRHNFYHATVRDAEARLAGAQNRVEAAHYAVTDLAAALDQLDMIAPRQAPAEAPAHELEPA
jgi:F0F1-type ATP synthase membrane subunit b/b'